jgi:hypothetical protein
MTTSTTFKQQLHWRFGFQLTSVSSAQLHAELGLFHPVDPKKRRSRFGHGCAKSWVLSGQARGAGGMGWPDATAMSQRARWFPSSRGIDAWSRNPVGAFLDSGRCCGHAGGGRSVKVRPTGSDRSGSGRGHLFWV